MYLRLLWAALCVAVGLSVGIWLSDFAMTKIESINKPLSLPFDVQLDSATPQQALKALVAAGCTLWGLAFQDDIKALARSFNDRASDIYWSRRGFFRTSGLVLAFAAAAACGANAIISMSKPAPPEFPLATLEYWAAGARPETARWREFRKVAWHYYFHVGKLDQAASNVTAAGDCEGPLSPSGATLRNYDEDWPDDEATTSMVSIIRSLSACVADEEKVQLSIAAYASAAKWKHVDRDGKVAVCRNYDALNGKLREARVEKMRKLFADAKAQLKASGGADPAWLDALDLKDVSDKVSFNIDDRAFEARRDDAEKLTDISDTPFPIRQSAVVMLENPGACRNREIGAGASIPAAR